MKFFGPSLVASIFLLASATGASANLISNGSFETPVVNPGTFSNFVVGTSLLTDWTVFGPVNKAVSIVSGTFSQAGVTFPAQDGVQWVDMTGFNHNSTEGVSQAVTTIAGDQYQLSYYIGNTTGGGIFGTTSTVNVLLNGAQAFSDTNSAVNASSLTWTQFTHTFVASGASTTIGFENGDPVTDNSNGLDNIVLLDLGPATNGGGGGTGVPEPSALALLGLGVLGLVRRRRAKS
jgi:hypothetical protein